MAAPIVKPVIYPGALPDVYDIYIPDTNVLLSYPFLIPSPTRCAFPSSSPIDFNHKHIIIPSIINAELDCLKGQHISVSTSAFNTIRRLERMSSCPEACFDLEGAYNLRNNLRLIYPAEGSRSEIDILFSYWCVNEDVSAPPFYPAEGDGDGKILAAALNLEKTKWFQDIENDYRAQKLSRRSPIITILSNDHNMRVRARNFGLKAASYSVNGLNARTPGRRTVNAPSFIYKTFISKRIVPGYLWRQHLPNEPLTIPNEYIILKPPQPKPKANPAPNPRSKRKHGRPNKTARKPVEPAPESEPIKNLPPSRQFNYIGRYDAEADALVALEHLDTARRKPENIGQAIHIDAAMNPKIGVIIADNTPHYRSNSVAVVSYRSREPAFTETIYDELGFN